MPSAVTRDRGALATLIGFQAVWWIAALSAAEGTGVPGLVAALAFAGYRLMAQARGEGLLRAMLLSATCGFLAESVLCASGLVRYTAPWPGEAWAPPWIVGLWLAFGGTIDTLRRMAPKLTLAHAAMLGALAGPASYLGAAEIGALELAQPPIGSVIAIAVIWAAVLPLLLLLHDHVQRPARTA